MDDPVAYPELLAAGDRLILEISGGVEGFRPDTAGGLGHGALVASFAGGPAFLVAEEARDRRSGRAVRLLWTAPANGRLAFAVTRQSGSGDDLAGGYAVRVTAIGRRGDPRQRAFAPPRVAFLPRSPRGGLLAVIYEDRAGFGLDRKTLKVVLDSEAGERVVLSPYFRVGPRGARLPALPPGVELPPGVHRVTATIGDALGNISPPAVAVLDQP